MTTGDITTTNPDPVTRGLAQLLAGEMSGLKMVNDAMVDITTTVDDAGEYIDVTVTRRPFHGPDSSIRVLLHVTEPMTSEYAEEDAPETSANGVGAVDEPTDGAA